MAVPDSALSEETPWHEIRSAGPPALQERLSATDDFRNLFAACDRLELFVLEGFKAVAGEYFPPLDPRFQTWVLTFRCVKSFDAALNLSDLGYGPQAMILARTMIEDVVTALWCRSQPGERLLELLDRHERSVAARIQAGHLADRAVTLRSLRDIPTLTDEQISVALGDTDPNVASRHWTKKSVHKMASAVTPDLRPRDTEVLARLTDVEYLVANLVTHNSPAAMGTVVTNIGALIRSPSRLLVHDALSVAYDVITLLAVLATPESKRSELDDVVDRDRWVFVVLPDDAKVDRNEECPCGSGRKYKRCHGS